MKNSLLRYGISIVSILVLWWLGSMVVEIALSGPKSDILPDPASAFRALIGNWSSIYRHFFQSALRLILALFFSVLIGSTIGLLIGSRKRLDRLLAPFLYVLYPIPKVVFLPLILVLLGLGNLARIVFVFLVAVFQVLISTRDAAKGVSQDWITAVRSSGGSSLQIYRHVIIPATLPAVFTSARVSVGLGIAALYLAETSFAQRGLGHYIDRSWHNFAYADVFAGIMALATLGLFLYLIIDLLERYFCRWQFIGK